MSKFIKINNVQLDGYQAIVKPSQKFNNYTLAGTADQSQLDQLIPLMEQAIQWCQSKPETKGRKKTVPSINGGIKLNWKASQATPEIVDSRKQRITDENLPLYAGSVVNLVVQVKPWIMQNRGNDYGCSIRPVVIQVVSLPETNSEVTSVTDSDVDPMALLDDF